MTWQCVVCLCVCVCCCVVYDLCVCVCLCVLACDLTGDDMLIHTDCHLLPAKPVKHYWSNPGQILVKLL